MIALSMALSFGANASTINTVVTDVNTAVLQGLERGTFDWKVGDSATYNLKAGFIKGTMVMGVKAVAADSVTLTQDMDLGFMGKQACEIVLNPQTGETKSMVCNGQAQDPGQNGNVEIIESKEDTVTVPAGTFTCLYIKAKQDQNIVQQWINPKQVPVMGLVKTIAPSQIGDVNIELVSFKKM